MPLADEHRSRARRAWATGDWDAFAHHLEPVGPVVLDRIGIGPGDELVDVGTGSGGTIAIPAALRGARVVASDVTPELFAAGRRRAMEAGVQIDWVDADARDLPFGDGTFDAVVSTFGALFAPDHRRAAAELVRVCRPGGRIAMTTWTADGYAGALFDLSGSYVPARTDADPSKRWGEEVYARAVFAAAGVKPAITRERVDFAFPSVEAAVDVYARQFGPLVAMRGILEPQGRWDAYAGDLAALLHRFARPQGDGVAIRAEYLLITATR